MKSNSYDRKSLGRAVLFAVSIILLAAGCSPHESTRPDVVRPVKTMVVAAGEEPHMRSFPGKVEASKKVELAFRVPGLLVKLPVREGQSIAKGEVIAQLRQDEFQARLKALQGQLDQARAALRALRSGERPEQRLRLEAQVRAAEAKLANARTEFNRNARLLRSRAASREEFELSETAYRVAQEEYTAARQMLEKGMIAREEDIQAKEAEVRGLEGRVVEANIQLEDCTLRAPYDGVIAQRFVEQNQNVMAKQPVVKFQDVDEIDVAVDVPESVMAADVRSADIVQLVAEFNVAPGLQFPVHIKEVAQSADPTTQTFRVRVAMKAPTGVNLLPGMTATVTLTSRRASILGSPILVPISAVFKDATGEQVAWVIDSDQSVRRHPVKVGAATGGQVEIVDGLQPGDRIAVAGVTFLREGMKVRDLGDALGGGQL
ncbi:MAG: efflux RND transporter periplasmic adaptor subunit [Planctomycetaceae bacterium]|nr:efflux RND transporter periplasmic adaptor subunit [Planctomycetaceae bacterium]